MVGHRGVGLLPLLRRCDPLVDGAEREVRGEVVHVREEVRRDLAGELLALRLQVPRGTPP